MVRTQKAGRLPHAAHLLERDDLEITGYDASWSDLQAVHPHADFIRTHKKIIRYPHPPVSVDIQAALLGSELAKLTVARALGNLPDEPQTVTCAQILIPPGSTPPR